jgi:hypothetical protein
METLSCGRRTILLAALGSVAIIGLPISTRAIGQAATTRDGPRSIAYFNDSLLSDPTGQLPAYRRPAGFRGARGWSRLSQAEQIWTSWEA